MSETERTFAVDLQRTLNIDSPPSLDQTHEVEPLRQAGSECACSVHRCGRCELGGADDRLHYGDLRAGRGSSYMAGRLKRRHEYRAGWHGSGFEGACYDCGGSVYERTTR